MATILACSQDDLPLDLKTQVIAILASDWPDERSVEDQLRAPLHDPRQRPRVVVLLEDDVILSYLVIPATLIHVGDHSFRASGLSAVITDPTQRNRGYGRRIVTAARDLIAASDADIGVFTCDPPLVDFYVRCGWTLMPHTIVIGGTRDTPFRADELGKCTLMGFFSDHARTHRPIFDGAELYLELGEGELW